MYRKIGKITHQKNNIQTLLDFAVKVEQVDLVEFVMSKGGHITENTLDMLLLIDNIDVANLILQNVDINLVSEEQIGIVTNSGYKF